MGLVLDATSLAADEAAEAAAAERGVVDGLVVTQPLHSVTNCSTQPKPCQVTKNQCDQKNKMTQN